LSFHSHSHANTYRHNNHLLHPITTDTHVVRERGSVQEQSYGTAKGPILNYHVVKEIEQKSGHIYGMKGQSTEGKQVCWCTPAILS
jgi:hypothetical protein